MSHLASTSPARRTAGVSDSVRALPVFCMVASAVALAWRHDGSILASDWLPYAFGLAVLAATVFLASRARTARIPLLAAGLIASLGLWTGVSAFWSPVPTLARDELLLCALYALSLLFPVLTLKTTRARTAALTVVAFGLGGSAVAAALTVRFDAHPSLLFTDGRLTAPISYVNAQAAFFLVGFWPAVVIASRRGMNPGLRAVAVGSAAAMLAGWLTTQSKGGGIALAVSALVLFAVAPGRRRLLLPTLGIAALVYAQFDALTGPFRALGNEAAARDAGLAVLTSAAAAALLGLLYALVDNRWHLPLRVTRAARVVVVAAAVVAIAILGARVAPSVRDPGETLADKWESFKGYAPTASGRSHLVNLGSNRYDFWRVSLRGFADHPIGGIGGRGFGPAYLEDRKSDETPARSHSLPLDVLLETGVIGLVLLLAGLGVALFGVVRRRATPEGVAALGASVYFIVHASGDWIWTFPAVGLPAFALIGISLADNDLGQLSRKGAALAATGMAAVALVVFFPPWLSARITSSALEGEVSADALKWAQRLDPFAVEPLLAEAALAPEPAGAVRPLQEAVEKQPRSVGLRVELARVYLALGRRADARVQLLQAQRLFPSDDGIALALKRTAPTG